MKIAIVHSYLARIGGANIFIQEVANRLARFGHEVNVIAARIRRQMYEFDDKVKTHSVSDLHGKDIRFWISIPLLVKKLCDKLQSCDPDIAIANHFPSYSAVLRSELPGVWMCQEPFPFFHNQKVIAKDIKTQLMAMMISLLYSKYDINIARRFPLVAGNSSFTRKEIRRVFKRDCEIVYPGFDEKLLEEVSTPKREATVLAGSPTTLLKGFEYTLDAYLKLKSEGKAQQLRVVGNLHPVYRKMIHRALLKHPDANIVVMGPVNRTELVNEYKRATLLAYPSLREPFGIMPLEAAALGTPVLYFESGGLRETMRTGVTGKGVQSGDRNKFKQTMDDLLSNPMTLDRDSDDFREHIVKFSWRATVAKLLNLCEQAIGRSV
ncbi:MAG: glycosyltransferase family 4 protein [Candidatus Thorarchaeota archaeon]